MKQLNQNRSKLIATACCFSIILFSAIVHPCVLFAQEFKQTVRGIVFDQESQKPLAGVNVNCTTCKPVIGCATDSLGRFVLQTGVGRHSFSFTHIGYQNRIITNVQVGTGKSVFLEIPLTERFYQAQEVSVTAENMRAINPMAVVSVRSLKSEDAGRYAGGYFDPSRMAANFPGVASSNSDDSNELVIRGNSPRGVLWRIEGIEIPNPNHLSNGQGDTGGGYSAISTNVLSAFDFFTGSFPAEYGNASSGVMDLFLRKGNTENYEIAAGLSVLGLEFSAEGPINKKKGNSFMFDYRHADFSFLTKYNIIDRKNLGIPPRTTDWATKSTFKTTKAGNIEVFGLGAESTAGDIALSEIENLKNGFNMNEYFDSHSMSVIGIKQSMALPNNKTYMRNTVAFTYDFNSDRSSIIDTLFRRTTTYYEFYEYMAARLASLFNHKLNARHSIRAGITFNYIWGNMFAHRLTKTAGYDTLMNGRDNGFYGSTFVQWKYQTGKNIEISPGMHFFFSGINREILAEPRISMLFRLPKNQSLNFGSGIHSRIEPFSVYNYMIKISETERVALNKGIKTTKAFHLTLGYNKSLSNHLRFEAETYFQYLFDVPVNKNSSYSILNLSYGLPDVTLENKGFGKNSGIELTLEKQFSNNYFFLATTSLFDSKYKAGSNIWYNTYYNSNYVLNIVGGKEYTMGKYRQNTLGIKFRGLFRRGFRYTPVNINESIERSKLVYNENKNYGKHLPGFRRIDFGISYRLNKQKLAWTFMADIQNIFNTENILRRRFYFQNNEIVTRDSKSFGMIPVITIKLEKKVMP